MWYFTRKAILEHYGKNGKNVRRLDRAIKRWAVVHANGMYAPRYDYDLQRMIKMKKEIKELKDKADWGDANLVRGLKDDLDFQIAENDKLKKEYEEKIEDITKRCWEYMNKRRVPPVDNMAQFKYWIKWEDYKDIQFSPEEIQGGL